MTWPSLDLPDGLKQWAESCPHLVMKVFESPPCFRAQRGIPRRMHKHQVNLVELHQSQALLHGLSTICVSPTRVRRQACYVHLQLVTGATAMAGLHSHQSLLHILDVTQTLSRGSLLSRTALPVQHAKLMLQSLEGRCPVQKHLEKLGSRQSISLSAWQLLSK